MQRPLAMLLAAIALVASALSAPVGCGAGPREPPKPNIVLIVTDDQAPSTLEHMPFVARHLISEGTSFENFLVSDPICCPSRATILLGQYRHNHHVEHSPEQGCAARFASVEGQHKAIGALVSAAGYRTGVIGKYLNRYDKYLDRFGAERRDGDLLQGWDETHIVATPRYYNIVVHQNGQLIRYAQGDGESSRENYQTDVLSNLAAGFIKRSVEASMPFFLYLAPEAPHERAISAKRHRDLFPDLRAPRGPSFNEPDISDKATLSNFPPIGEGMIATIDARYGRMVRSLQAVDELVDRLVTLLDELEVLDHTYLIYTSDNGFHFGEHRIVANKATPFEEGIRVPFVVRGPGIARGWTTSSLAANVDIHPTVLDLVGERMGPGVDGRSLVPLWAEGADGGQPRTAFLLESNHLGRTPGIPRFTAIRTPRFKLIEYRTGARELYDLQNDPYELENSYESTDPLIRDELSKRLRALQLCIGKRCEQLETEPFTAGGLADPALP